MANIIDHEKEHECPIYNKIIDPDLCYDIAMCMNGMFKVESVSELAEVKDIEAARTKCNGCPYSDME